MTVDSRRFKKASAVLHCRLSTVNCRLIVRDKPALFPASTDILPHNDDLRKGDRAARAACKECVEAVCDCPGSSTAATHEFKLMDLCSERSGEAGAN